MRTMRNIICLLLLNELPFISLMQNHLAQTHANDLKTKERKQMNNKKPK